MNVRKEIDKIPRLDKKICCLKKELENLTYVKELTNLELDTSSILTINYVDQEDVTQTLSVDLSVFVNTPNEFIPNIVVENYTELLTITGQSLFEFAEVQNSEGTSYLPGFLGGTYKAAGLYHWNGTEWIHDNDAIYEGLQNLINTLANLQTQVNTEVTNRTTKDTDLQNQITTNDTDITSLQNSKRGITAQKRSIVSDSGDLQLKNDEDSPGNSKSYGTNSEGVKGWYNTTDEEERNNFLLLQWQHLVLKWDTQPTLDTTLSGGRVFKYTLGGVVRYRYVPNTYVPVEDAFFSSFNGTILTDKITQRGLEAL